SPRTRPVFVTVKWHAIWNSMGKKGPLEKAVLDAGHARAHRVLDGLVHCLAVSAVRLGPQDRIADGPGPACRAAPVGQRAERVAFAGGVVGGVVFAGAQYPVRGVAAGALVAGVPDHRQPPVPASLQRA